MRLWVLILFVTFSLLVSSTILFLLFQTLLTATTSLSVVFLTNMLLLKQRQFILDHINPGLLLNFMLKKLHAANYRESGLVLISTFVLKRLRSAMNIGIVLLSLRPNAPSMLLLFLLV